MHKRLIPLLIGVAALAACSDNDDNGTTLRVQNQSDFVITDIRVTQVDNPSFGPNLLGGDVLNPGEEITLGVACDTYDARVIDETGAECDLSAVDLCFNDAVWVITNQTCPVFNSGAKAHQGSQLAIPRVPALNPVPHR
jgi:hypothetical protein